MTQAKTGSDSFMITTFDNQPRLLESTRKKGQPGHFSIVKRSSSEDKVLNAPCRAQISQSVKQISQVETMNSGRRYRIANINCNFVAQAHTTIKMHTAVFRSLIDIHTLLLNTTYIRIRTYTHYSANINLKVQPSATCVPLTFASPPRLEERRWVSCELQ